MNCSIVYYAARKTSLCEKVLRRHLPGLGLTLLSAGFATKRETLGDALTKGFSDADMVLTVGGLSFADSRGVRNIVSQAAAGSRPFCRRLRNSGGDDGYLLRAGKQVLVLLPDEPEQLDAMLRGALADYIKTL